MKALFASRSGNTIYATIEVISGYNLPIVYPLSGNATIPDPSVGPVETAIVDYYNALSDADKNTWNEVTANTTSTSNTPSTSNTTSIETFISFITKRQFTQQLVVEGIITEAEAEAFFAGVIPPEIETVINQLPEAKRFPLRLALLGASSFDINSTFVADFAAQLGWSKAQLQAFWDAAYLL